MKEYITREIKPGKYEYGYKIQLLDIKMMLELGIKIPDKMNDVYNEKIKESELTDYVYFKNPEIYEFIRRQYYIRDYLEYASMNLYEIELLLSFYDKSIKGIISKISKMNNKERINDLNLKLKILTNEMQGIISIRNNLIDNHNKKK